MPRPPFGKLVRISEVCENGRRRSTKPTRNRVKVCKFVDVDSIVTFSLLDFEWNRSDACVQLRVLTTSYSAPMSNKICLDNEALYPSRRIVYLADMQRFKTSPARAALLEYIEVTGRSLKCCRIERRIGSFSFVGPSREE